MFKIENSVTIAIILYLFLISLVVYYKPRIIFTQESRIKRFGTGKNKTIFPLWLVAIVLSILSYYMVLLIKLINKNNFSIY